MTSFLLNRILLGYDGTEQSVRALEFVIGLLQEGAPKPTEIHLAYIVEKPPGIADPMPEEAMNSLQKVGQDILLNGARIVKKAFESPFTHLEFGPPPEKLLELADKLKPNLIVIGIAKHPSSDRILGTISSLLFRSRKYPVLGVP